MVIIAEEQTGGVGRMGRAWVSPVGGIWITVVLKPHVPIDHIFMITMAGSIAVARAIRKEFDLGALIKWPNDIFIGNKKVAGLLLELAAEADTVHYCLLGIGIDVKRPAQPVHHGNAKRYHFHQSLKSVMKWTGLRYSHASSRNSRTIIS